MREYFYKHAKNSKETWNKINQVLNNKKSSCDNIYLTENGIITDPYQVMNQFNNYFVIVAEKLTLKQIGKTNNQNYLQNGNEHSMYLTKIAPGETKT